MILANHLHMPSYCLKTFTECPYYIRIMYFYLPFSAPSASSVVRNYSNSSVPKKSGRWKSGFSISIGFHDRKWGVCNSSPHL